MRSLTHSNYPRDGRSLRPRFSTFVEGKLRRGYYRGQKERFVTGFNDPAGSFAGFVGIRADMC